VRLGIFFGWPTSLARINVRVRYEDEHRTVLVRRWLVIHTFIFIPSIFKEEDSVPCRQEAFPRDLVSRDRNVPRGARCVTSAANERARTERAERRAWTREGSISAAR